METKIIINFNEEQGNYLQRLGIEVDSKAFLIERMFQNHMRDTDTVLFDSVPFKAYEQKYEEAHAAFELAKANFENNYLKPRIIEQTGIENPSFTWAINDYLSGECEVTIVS